jgi:hypothetical protein
MTSLAETIDCLGAGESKRRNELFLTAICRFSGSPPIARCLLSALDADHVQPQFSLPSVQDFFGNLFGRLWIILRDQIDCEEFCRRGQMRQKSGVARAGMPGPITGPAVTGVLNRLPASPNRGEFEENKSSWSTVTGEMFGGQHRVDEVTRDERSRLVQRRKLDDRSGVIRPNEGVTADVCKRILVKIS